MQAMECTAVLQKKKCFQGMNKQTLSPTSVMYVSISTHSYLGWLQYCTQNWRCSSLGVPTQCHYSNRN